MAQTNVADNLRMRRDELNSSNEHIKARWGVGMIAFMIGSIALILMTLYMSQL
jgi:hypothetical protein